MAAVTLGDFRITLVRAGAYHWDGGAVFGVVPKTLWSRRAACDDLNRVPLGFNCYVIETGDHTVLVETGGGDKMDDRARERMKLPPRCPSMPEHVAAAGIDPDRVDIVLNTHLHWDHCGGNTDNGGRAAFPRAVYYTRRAEWEHAHERHVRDAVSYIDANYDGLVESGRMRLIEEDAEIVPGIRLALAPGHNRDMMVATAESRGDGFVFFSDLTPSAAHLPVAWIPAFDLYPLQSIATRVEWLTRAAERGWLIGFGHDCEIAFARVCGDPFRIIETF
ncbi:MAG: MBL fold metallo-hydrolase [Bryobacteraceae bacterium]